MININNKVYDKVIIYDLETDGYFTNKGYTRPLEVGLIMIQRVEDKVIVEGWNQLIKYRKYSKIPAKATAVNGITTELVNKYGLPIEDVFKWLDNIFEPGALVAGHNILRFDNKFINQRFIKYGYEKLGLDMFDTAGEFRAAKLKWIHDGQSPIEAFHLKALNMRIKGLTYTLDEALEEYDIAIRDENTHIAFLDALCTTILMLIQMTLKENINSDLATAIIKELYQIKINEDNRDEYNIKGEGMSKIMINSPPI